MLAYRLVQYNYMIYTQYSSCNHLNDILFKTFNHSQSAAVLVFSNASYTHNYPTLLKM